LEKRLVTRTDRVVRCDRCSCCDSVSMPEEREGMTIRRQVGILGAALLFSAPMARLSSAQEQASEAATEKHDSSSKADETEGHSIAKTSGGTQPGLLKRFLDDQQRVWTSPTRSEERRVGKE